MADGDKRKALATATTGYGLVGAGALLSEHGIKSGTELAGGKRMRPPAMALVKAPFSLARRNARLAYLGGRGISTVGGTGAAAGTFAYLAHRKSEKEQMAKAASQFIAQGLQGNVEAIRQKKDNLTQPTPLKARAVPIAAGAVVGGAAGHGIHQLLDHSKFKHTKLRPALVAMGATGAIGASLPLTTRLMHHVTPGYTVTPTGVTKDKKTKIKRASSKATIAEGRSSKGADPRMFRQQVVGKAHKPDYFNPWEKEDAAYARKIRDAEVSIRAHERREGHRPGTFVYGYDDMSYPAWEYKPAKYVPGRKQQVFHEVVAQRKSTAVGPKRNPHPKKRVAKMADASEIHVMGTDWRKKPKKLRMPGNYEVKQSVGKALIEINTKPNTGMTPQQARAQLNAKKRKLVTDVAATGLGVGGLALLAASSKHSPMPKHLHEGLRRAAGTTAILGGGVSAANGIQGAKITHRDIKAQEKVQGLSKGMTIPSFRGSYLQTRRLRNGTIKPVRVNGGVVR